MLRIAEEMFNLHESGVPHRDLKASNILLQHNFRVGNNHFFFVNHIRIVVADFECSIGVLGTGFWKVPKILTTLRNTSIVTNEQWKKVDVYSYSMTCFEIVTGLIPFNGELENTRDDCQLVIEDRRPHLPSDLDDAMKDLITKCWEPNPEL